MINSLIIRATSCMHRASCHDAAVLSFSSVAEEKRLVDSTKTSQRFNSSVANVVDDDSYEDDSSHDEAQEIIDSIKFESKLPSVVYLYDKVGSDLFEDITRTQEYYLTRTELNILKENAVDIARFNDENFDSVRKFKSSLIELGAGSGKKLFPLLDALANIPKTAKCSYIPSDVSASALEENVLKYNRNRKNVEPFEGTHDDAMRELSARVGRKHGHILVRHWETIQILFHS
jgi:uncharacterized SAM-dependent methyltransferase